MAFIQVHHSHPSLPFSHQCFAPYPRSDYERYLLPYQDDPTGGFHIIDRPRNNSAFLSEPCFYIKLDVNGSGKGMIVDHILNRNLVPNRQPASNGAQTPSHNVWPIPRHTNFLVVPSRMS